MTFSKKSFFSALCALAVSSLLSGAAIADPLLLDRGLPVDNINNSAGANRSNVSWSFGGYTPTDYYLVGDTFTNTSALAWRITSLRLWTVGTTTTATLWGGTQGTTAGQISDATYGDGITNYQGTTGRFVDMHQVDFAVDILLAAGDTFSFFFDGTGNTNPATIVPCVHASNAALGGSPADGADDLMLWAQSNGSSIVDTGTWTSLGNGWDKASDVNVQVFGNAVPEPGSIALVGIGLLGAVSARRRNKR